MTGDIPYNEVNYGKHREEMKERVKRDSEYAEEIKEQYPDMYYEWEFTPDKPTDE